MTVWSVRETHASFQLISKQRDCCLQYRRLHLFIVKFYRCTLKIWHCLLLFRILNSQVFSGYFLVSSSMFDNTSMFSVLFMAMVTMEKDVFVNIANLSVHTCRILYVKIYKLSQKVKYQKIEKVMWFL